MTVGPAGKRQADPARLQQLGRGQRGLQNGHTHAAIQDIPLRLGRQPLGADGISGWHDVTQGLNHAINGTPDAILGSPQQAGIALQRFDLSHFAQNPAILPEMAKAILEVAKLNPAQAQAMAQQHGLASVDPQLVALDASAANTLAFLLLNHAKASYLNAAALAPANQALPHPDYALARGQSGAVLHQLSTPSSDTNSYHLLLNAAQARALPHPQEAAERGVELLRGGPVTLNRETRLKLASEIADASTHPDFDPSGFLVDPRSVDLSLYNRQRFEDLFSPLPGVAQTRGEELTAATGMNAEQAQRIIVGGGNPFDRVPVTPEALDSMRQHQVAQDAAHVVQGLVLPPATALRWT
jgi:hypothetical protein